MVADNLGSDADAPSEIPVRAWREVWRRAIWRAFDEGLLTEAAGVAFYALFALFAGLAAFVSFWGMLADPAALGRRVRDVGDALPG
jgi:membrane protein